MPSNSLFWCLLRLLLLSLSRTPITIISGVGLSSWSLSAALVHLVPFLSLYGMERSPTFHVRWWCGMAMCSRSRLRSWSLGASVSLFFIFWLGCFLHSFYCSFGFFFLVTRCRRSRNSVLHLFSTHYSFTSSTCLPCAFRASESGTSLYEAKRLKIF